MSKIQPEQSLAKHTQVVPGYLAVFGLIFVTLIGSLVNLYQSMGDHIRIYSASLITALAVAMVMLFFYARTFPLKAQDRVIRSEENLRHFVLTGRLLDPRITTAQMIGLRFASDGEFPALALRAASENLSAKEIKHAVKTWRPDYERL